MINYALVPKLNKSWGMRIFCSFFAVILLSKSIATYSLKFRCSTNSSIVGDSFEKDSKPVLKKAESIWKCGRVPEEHFDESFGPCILSLNLPENFQILILEFKYDNFESEILFKRILESVAVQVCGKLKRGFNGIRDRPYSEILVEKDNSEDFMANENLSISESDTENLTIKSGTDSVVDKSISSLSSIINWYFVGLSVLTVLIVATIIFVYRYRLDVFKSTKRKRASVDTKDTSSADYNIHNSESSKLPAYSPPSSATFNSDDPPSYDQVQSHVVSSFTSLTEEEKNFIN